MLVQTEKSALDLGSKVLQLMSQEEEFKKLPTGEWVVALGCAAFMLGVYKSEEEEQEVDNPTSRP